LQNSQEKLLDLDNILRELARKEYASYVEYVHRGRWIPARHLLFVCEKIQSFIEAETTNPYDILILQMPPQHGKSMSTTETLPSWFLGKWPNKRVIEISYNEDFAQLFGRRNRGKLQEFGGPLFGVELAKKPNSDTEFEMSNGVGGMISRGVMSGITGRPGDLMIIDDPIKNRQEADSETYRKRLWDEWQNSFKTRLSAGAKVIVIQTRWHEADLAGMIIANEENVTVINLPCEAEENDPLGREKGDPLFPEIGKDKTWLGQFKRSYINDPTVDGGGNRAWLALFQGRPSAQEGNMLKRHWWRYWKPKGVDLPPVTVKLPNGDYTNIEAIELPDKFDRTLQSWDMTFKDSDGTDLVAGGVWGAKGASIFKLDLIYERMDFVATLQAFLTMTAKWPDVTLKLVEDKANGPAVISMLRLKIGGIIPVLPEGSKQARASAVSPLIEAGNVYLPHPLIAGWVNTFIDQCANFPNGVNDDLVDEMSQALKRFMYARDQEPVPDLPDTLPPDLLRDLQRDPAAMAHFLSKHPEYRG
jgi:predicted phage terminase large subunit-like protein